MAKNENELREGLKRAIEKRDAAEAVVAKARDMLELARAAVLKTSSERADIEDRAKKLADNEVDVFSSSLAGKGDTLAPVDNVALLAQAERKLDVARAARTKCEESLREAEGALTFANYHVQDRVADLLALHVDDQIAALQKAHVELEDKRSKLWAIQSHLRDEPGRKALGFLRCVPFTNEDKGRQYTLPSAVEAMAMVEELLRAPNAALP